MKSTLVFALLVISLFACGSKSNDNADISTTISDSERFNQESFLLNPVSFNNKIKSSADDAVILDVRTPREYYGGALEGSINLDYYDKDFKSSLSKMEKQKPYFVYCHVGGRSQRVKQMMNQMGFTKVYDLAGGIVEWRKEGLKLVKP